MNSLYCKTVKQKQPEQLIKKEKKLRKSRGEIDVLSTHMLREIERERE